MESKEIGTTGVMVPEIGLGMWNYQSDLEPLQRGIALGAFLLDTAEMYGTEDITGAAARGQRDRVFIASKVSGSHLRAEQVLHAADASLRRLGTDYIDLYQVHWPNSRVPIAETMGAMEQLADAGKVRFIGVSNFSVRELREAQAAMGRHPIVSNQVLYNLLEREIEESLLPYCEENGITVIAYTPLAAGRLTSRPLLRNGKALEVLERVARDAGKTMAQVALNWCTTSPRAITIPKAGSVAHVEEDCGASGWRLSANQAETLNRAFAP